VKNPGHVCNRIIEFAFYALFFLTPLAFSPFNFELFEFNKMLVVYALTAVITGAWLIKIVLAKKVIFRRSFWDWPLVLFFLSQVISYLFSIDRQTSFWGYYSRFNGGLLSVISYLLLYWAFVSNINSRITYHVLRITLASAALVAAYGIAEHFGIDAQYWVQDVKNRVFSTLGQPNWLAAWLAALLPLGLAFAVNLELTTYNFKLKKVISYLFLVISFLCLWYTKSRSGLMAAAISVGVLVALQLAPRFKRFWPVTIVILAGVGLIGGKILWDRNRQDIRYVLGFTDKVEITPQMVNAGGSKSADIRKVVWRGAIDIWRHHPLFGTGPETFAYSYYWYRPREHNDLSEWDFLYNKAHNEYLNYAATTGTLGLVAYLILIGSFLVWSVKKVISCQLSVISSALAAGFTSIAVTNFFGFSVVPVSLLFFLFPAFAVTISDTKDEIRETKENPKIFASQRLISAGILLFTFYFLLLILKYWYADAQFSKAEKLGKAGQYNLAYGAASSTVSLRPFEPSYHDELGLDLAGLAALAQNDKTATLSAQLAKMAVEQSTQALKISPFNLNFWKNRIKIFYRLGEVDGQYYQQALATLLQAEQLAPTDPKIKYNLGLLYAQFGQTETAITTLEETVKLKPNYIDVRYALSLLYRQIGRKDEARQQLEEILRIDPQNQKIKDMLEKK